MHTAPEIYERLLRLLDANGANGQGGVNATNGHGGANSAVSVSGPARVVVLGDFMLDRYLYGDAERISPEAPVPVLRIVRREAGLGGAASVAANVAALGAEARCVGVIGDDDAGRELAGMLTRAGVGCERLLTVRPRPTTVKTRLVGLAQHRHRQQIVRMDEEDAAPIDAETERRLLEALSEALGGARRAAETSAARESPSPQPSPFKGEGAARTPSPRTSPFEGEGVLGSAAPILCIQDYGKGVVTESLCQQAIAAAKRVGARVLIDPIRSADTRRYAGAWIMTPNRTETETILGRPLRSIDAVRAAAADILAACRTEHVCVTLDADGCALIGPGGTFAHLPTKPRDVYDVTGAGDAVLAALAVGLARGADLPDAAVLANFAGGLEVEKFGCVPVTRDEIAGEILIEHGARLGKVRSLAALLPELERRRRAKRTTVVFTNGCFDILHRGHVEYLAFCREQGDLVVVGLNSDASVRRQGKSRGSAHGKDNTAGGGCATRAETAEGGRAAPAGTPGGERAVNVERPVNPQDDRAAVLAGLASVDYVVIFDEDTPAALIEAVQPDVLVKGQDWAERGVVGRESVESRGGRVVLAPLTPGRSTTGVIERIRTGGP